MRPSRTSPRTRDAMARYGQATTGARFFAGDDYNGRFLAVRRGGPFGPNELSRTGVDACPDRGRRREGGLSEKPASPPNWGTRMPTIALVDDDRNILTSVSIALETEGYRIQTYTDGASALDGLKHSPPDLAIFDIKMPRMDGMELLRRLRQKSDLPVIFLTSKDEEIDELFGLKMGADDFIHTPFSQRLLVERVTVGEAGAEIRLNLDGLAGLARDMAAKHGAMAA